MSQRWYKHSKDGFGKLRIHAFQILLFDKKFSILKPFCNQNGMITLITKIFVIKVIIPFWLQTGIKIEKIL